MIKTVVMAAALAAFTGASVACFGLFSGGGRSEESCDRLTGQAKTDCEQQKTTKPR